MPPSPDPEVITYRNIPEGCGGTFSLTTPIGTRYCQTCVGLFIPISANQCYVAHINATVRIGTSYSFLRVVQGDEGPRLEDKVLPSLEFAASEGGWDLDCIDPEGITIICPRPDSPLVGHFVINAIAAFFGGKVGHQSVRRGCHGFVFDPSSGRTLMLPSEGFSSVDLLQQEWAQEVEDRPYRFVVLKEESAEDDWAPEVTR